MSTASLRRLIQKPEIIINQVFEASAYLEI